MKITSVDNLQNVPGGYLFDYNGHQNYMTDDIGSPVTVAEAQKIIDQLDQRFPVKWLQEEMFLLQYRLRFWSSDYGWSNDYDGEAFSDSHFAIGAQKNPLEALHTITHETGHLIFHHLVSPEKFQEWLKLRGMEKSLTQVWKDKPTEVFAEDFFYLFGGSAAQAGTYKVYDGTPDPPGPEVKEWFLSLRKEGEPLKIGVDIGHGGKDPGAIGLSGFTEKEANLGIGLALIEDLKRHGIKVISTRTDDTFLELHERSGLFNAEKVDVAVSVHCNGADKNLKIHPDYLATFIYFNSEKSHICATLVQRELVKATGWFNGGVRTKDLHMVRETAMPSILPECGFITNPHQEQQLKDPSFQKRIGQSITRGLINYLGLAYKEEPKIKTYTSDVAPFLKNDRLFLPVRAVIESAGGKIISWDQKTETAVCQIGNKKLTVQADNPEIKIEEV